MLQVEIPVHPMSRAIMLCEHGGEPVALEAHDLLWEILNTRITSHDLRQKSDPLTAYISLAVNDRLAAHLARFGAVAGHRLFKFHKHLLCRYADAQVRVKGKGHARPAIQEFLILYEIDEDHYSLETAYKLYQRFGWEIQKKNPHFVGRMRDKPGVLLSNFFATRRAVSEFSPDMALARFMSAVQIRMKRYHRRLEEQAQAYLYAEAGGYSARQIGEILGIAHSTAHHRARAMRLRCLKNPTYARLIEESLALPV